MKKFLFTTEGCYCSEAYLFRMMRAERWGGLVAEYCTSGVNLAVMPNKRT